MITYIYYVHLASVRFEHSVCRGSLMTTYIYIYIYTYIYIYVIHDTQSAQILQNQDGHNIYVIMKTMCLPGYHHNGFVATHALGHMMYANLKNK